MFVDSFTSYEDVCEYILVRPDDASFDPVKKTFAIWVRLFIDAQILIDAAFACKNGNQWLLPDAKIRILDVQVKDNDVQRKMAIDWAKRRGFLADFELVCTTILGDPFMFE